MASNYYDYITETGVIVPDTETVLSELQAMMRELFGQDMDLTAETPQGRLLEMWVRNREFCIQICAMVSNMLNLNKASGFVLDDLGALFLLSRKPASHTTVSVMMNGVAGTIIPANTRLKTTAGDIFVNDLSGTIGADGQTTIEYHSVETGQIPCVAGTLTIILDGVNGLETVTNPEGPVSLGQDLESDDLFRLRIKNGLNVNSIAILSAIKSNLEGLTGVIGSYCYDNYTDQDVVVDGLTVGPHSLLAVVDGGNLNEIAKVLYSKKTLGTGYIEKGGVNEDYDVIEESVIDESYGTTYKVRFIRPILTDIDIDITVRRKNYTGNDLDGAIKTAIQNFVDGKNPEVDGVVIGGPVSPFEISAAVSSEIPEIFIQEVKVGEHGGALSPETLTSIGYIHKANITPANITVHII